MKMLDLKVLLAQDAAYWKENVEQEHNKHKVKLRNIAEFFETQKKLLAGLVLDQPSEALQLVQAPQFVKKWQLKKLPCWGEVG